jgi:hypothetical protein
MVQLIKSLLKDPQTHGIGVVVDFVIVDVVVLLIIFVVETVVEFVNGAFVVVTVTCFVVLVIGNVVGVIILPFRILATVLMSGNFPWLHIVPVISSFSRDQNIAPPKVLLITY